MNYKQLIRDILPPILVRALRGSGRIPTFPTYAAALQQCGSGYQETSLAKVVVDKNIRLQGALAASPTKAFDYSAMRTLAALGLAANASVLRVLDFGGGGGSHYLIAKAVFGDKIDLRWNVVETETMVAEGKRLEDGQLKFFRSVDAAVKDLGQVDLVFSSGALQYTPDPIQCLEALLSVGASHLFITRTALSESGQKIIIQQSMLSTNGPGPLPDGVQDKSLSYPATFVSKDAFEAAIKKCYDIKTLFTEERDAYKAGLDSIHMYGYHAVLA